MSDNDLIRRGDALQILDDLSQVDGCFGDAHEAIAALPAVTVGVRPLVWRDDGTNGHETDHAFGFYEVYPSPEGDMLSRDGVDSGVFPTLEAAKAAAQADYEARILAALDLRPAPRRYMGQIRAEGDGPREAECQAAGRCIAEERK